MIKEKSVVSLSYCLKNSAGEELDRAGNKDPLTYLHGTGQIVPGLEKALEGSLVGDKKEVVLTPPEAYGEISPEMRMKIARSQFPPDREIEPGMMFRADMGGGQEATFRVTAVEGDDVQVDGNHPLAGQTLHFSVEVLSIREASQEELDHGHAHGPGGAHSH